jgi:type II secretory pathway pseudopilin PulG
MSRTTSSSREPRAQEGFTLAALIVVLTVIAIVVAYTVPTQWSLVMKRERDRHTIFLMKQFAQAIDNFEAKHKSLPVSLDQLEKARKPRMLRGKGIWPNPLTGSEKDWILVPPGAVNPAGSGTPVPNPNQTNPAGGGVIGGGQQFGRDGQPANRQATPGDNTPRKLNKDASPKDYVGPFVAVRPNATGESFIELNGAKDYSDWVYSIYDLRNERTARAAALVPGMTTGATPPR